MSVTLGDGIAIDLADGETFLADATDPSGDVNFLSHAHGDHLFSTPPETLVCSETTARLAAARRDTALSNVTQDHQRVELLPSGHVPGSTAALVDGGSRRYLYTGDVSTRDRFFLDGFEPVEADVLIVESTYGKPGYEFPPQDAAEARIVDWLDETAGTPLLLFGYTLGRAQEIQRLVERSGRDGLYVSDAIADVNEVLERCLDVSFDAERHESGTELDGDDVLVLPSQTTRLAFVDDLVDRYGATKAGFSGWAVDDSYRFRADLDVAFPLSDHCDYRELLALVEAVDPETVYTQHGFADAFATHVRAELGIEATALKANQSTLDDF